MNTKNIKHSRPGFEIRAHRRTLDIKQVEGGRFIVGYGSTFEPPERYDDYGDIVNPRAFDESLKQFESGQKSIKILSQHGEPIGLWKELRVDDRGLYAVGELVQEVRAADEMLNLIKAGVIDSLSIGFFIEQSRELEQKTSWGAPVRELLKIDLKEISPVTFPANEYAKIMEVRSARTRDIERRNEQSALDALNFQLAAMAIKTKLV